MLKKLLFITVLMVGQLQAAGKLGMGQVYVPSALGPTEVIHTPYGFTVNSQPVCPSRMDKVLRGAGAAAVHALMQKGYVRVGQSANGQYSLDYQARLRGGGFWGATIGYFAGKGAVYIAGYGTISLISVATGPFAKGTFVALSKMAAPFIEVASNKVGLAGGIALGTATGVV